MYTNNVFQTESSLVTVSFSILPKGVMTLAPSLTGLLITDLVYINDHGSRPLNILLVGSSADVVSEQITEGRTPRFS